MIYTLFGLVTLLFTGVVLTYVYQDRVVGLFIQEVNKRLQSRVVPEKMNLSVLEKFPQVSLSFHNLVAYDATNAPPEEQDTLARADHLFLTFNVFDILRGNYTVNRIYLENADVRLWVDEQGNNNYTLFKPDTTGESHVKFDLDNVSLSNTRIAYRHAGTQQHHRLFAYDVTTTIRADGPLFAIGVYGDLRVDRIGIAEQVFFAEKALEIDANMTFQKEQGTITFQQSTLMVEDAAFALSGTYTDNEQERELDIAIEGMETNLQTLFSLLPPGVAKSTGSYQGTGEVSFEARIRGDLNKNASPRITADFDCKNGSLNAPDLSSGISNLAFTGNFDNGKAHALHTATLQIKDIRATMDGKPFTGAFQLTNLQSPYLSAQATGTVNLTTLSHFVQVAAIEHMEGSIDLDMRIEGSVRAISSRQPFKTSGSVHFRQAGFRVKDFPHALEGIQGKVAASQQRLTLTALKGKIGGSRMEVSGTLDNFFDHLFSEEEKKKLTTENLVITAEHINLDEWLMPGGEEEQADEPVNLSFLNLFEGNVTCSVKHLNVRRFRGEHIQGKLSLKNRELQLQNITATTNSGRIAFGARVDFRPESLIHVRIDDFRLNDVQIDSSFYTFHNFNQSFITDQHIRGALTADGNIVFSLDHYLNVRPASVVATINVAIKNGELIGFDPLQQSLEDIVDEQELKHIRFNELSNTLVIKDGQVEIPETFIVTNIRKLSYKVKVPGLSEDAIRVSPKVLGIWVRGKHGFDNAIAYHIESSVKLLKSDLLRIRVCSDIRGTSEAYRVVNYNCKGDVSSLPENNVIVTPPDGQDGDDDYIIIDEDDTFDF